MKHKKNPVNRQGMAAASGRRDKGWNRPAAFLYDRLHRGEHRNFDLKHYQTLLQLKGGDREAVREHYIRKYAAVLKTGVCCLLMLLAAVLSTAFTSRDIVGGRLLRPGYLEGETRSILSLQVEEESEERAVEVSVSGRRFTNVQTKRLLEQAERLLGQKIQGDNPSLEEVRENLWMPAQMLDGAVSVTYMTMPYGMLSESGEILGEAEETGTQVEIEAKLTCQEESRQVSFQVRLLPLVLSDEEVFRQLLESELEKADEEMIEQPYMTLPPSAGGKALRWLQPEDARIPVFAALCLLLPLAVWLISDSRVEEAAKSRQESLRLDYGSFMWKLTMLTGAGLTVRGAFLKIAEEYKKQSGDARSRQSTAGSRFSFFRRNRNVKNAEKNRPYIYEEIAMTCREMESGIPEAQAYEHFGRRCGLPCYIRLGGLLAQNLKKGSKGLAQILEREADSALEERRLAAREMSEKAGTKLLLPMMMMLGVVLFVLLVPAMMEM